MQLPPEPEQAALEGRADEAEVQHPEPEAGSAGEEEDMVSESESPQDVPSQAVEGPAEALASEGEEVDLAEVATTLQPEQEKTALGTELEDEIPTISAEQEQAPGPVERSWEDEPGEPELPPEEEDEVFSFWREEVELMTPLAQGTVIAGRYAVGEALDVQEDEILYQAHDLKSCWQCGFDENDPKGAFCARCGVLMDHRPEVRLLEVREDEAKPSAEKAVVARFEHESRHFLLIAEPEPEPEPIPELPPEPPTIRLLVGQRSDVGQVRELDEDSLFVMTLAPTYESRTGPVLGLYAVADGMGGHAGGEVASRMALRVLADRVMRTVVLPALTGDLVLEDEILALLRQATMAANDTVYLTRQKRENDMGTTLTTAFIRDDRLFLAHVGDCRIYRWSADGLEQLTTDHSVIANMIAQGQAQPGELYTHPHRSIVYRCIGDKPLVDVDSDMAPLAPGDRVILCCDGLWEMVRDDGIQDVMMQEADPQAACDLLVQRANAAGGEDNISVIVVQVEEMPDLEAGPA
ncbi:MAG: protein phosphatase 2C domain-containing protein [Anaerolineae bacterium]